ncbi:sensor histidine kinase [Arenibacter certesii]|uniref:histidine kinase n=1 Tax=Arenibacter certesii TaxID=228955 RepID=A0A918IX47_9FLAO|nr:HAMP domain-containing sensor histidine kinase [Arenibacter certesii]GGW36439.1 hypothetical protein GCM10007383_21750 [Arenibacter certesii]
MNHEAYDISIIRDVSNQKSLTQELVNQIFLTQIHKQTKDGLPEIIDRWNKVHKSFESEDFNLKRSLPNNFRVDSILKNITIYKNRIYQLTDKKDLNSLNNHDLQLIAGWQIQYINGLDILIKTLENEFVLRLSKLKYIISLLTFLFILFIWSLYKLYVKGIIESVKMIFEDKEIQTEIMEAILESTKHQIWSVNKYYKLISFNSSFSNYITRFFGVVPKLGDSIYELGLDFKDQQKTRNYIDEAISGNRFIIHMEKEIQDKTFNYEVSFNPIIDKNNQVTGCSVYQSEVTQRIRTLNKLKSSESSLREAQRLANIGSWEWDINNDKIIWSEHLYQIFNQNPKKFEPSFDNFILQTHPEDRNLIENNFREYFNNQEYIDFISRVVLKDGRIRHMRHLGKLQYNQDKLVRITGTTQDITFMEISKLQILHQYKELQNFVYLVSHNIRGPISTLLSLLLLYDENTDRSKEEIVDLIKITVEKLDSTIQEINHSLTLKNISESDMEKVDLKKIAEDVLELLSHDLNNHNAIININFKNAKYVFGFRSYYINIFYNLILNSLKYKSKNKPLQINLSSEPISGERVEVMVSDNGIGMNLTTANVKNRIFEMYGRLSGSTSGKGLGLYLAKTQVEAMNGSIDVDSELGKGSTFTLNLLAKQ